MRFLLLVLAMLVACNSGVDNSGNLFYLACAPNRAGGECTCYVTTEARMPVKVTVSHKNAGGSTGTMITATRGCTTTYRWPKSLVLPPGVGFLSQRRDFGVEFQAEDNKTIIIYCMNEDLVSTDAYLALPKYTTISGEYCYIVVSYTRPTDVALSAVNSFIILVGTEASTVFTMKFKLTGIILLEPQCSPPIGRNGATSTCRIGKRETFAAFTTSDLTGTTITSNKPISFYVGHQCAQVPRDVTACDHLIEMMPAAENFGFRFATIPSLDREADTYRVVAKDDNTNVKVSCVNGAGVPQPNMMFTINAGMFVERIIPTQTGFCFVECDLPCILMHYAMGHSYDDVTKSDPFMIYVPPLGQFKRFYTIVFAESLFIDTQGVQTRFDPKVTLIIPAAYYDLSKILFDGRPITSVLRPFECNSIKDGDGNNRAYICRFCVPDGVSLGDHSVEHTNPHATLGIIIYGYERENTYGYAGGMNLNPLAVTSFCFDGLDIEAHEGDGTANVHIQRTGPTKERACITMECSDGIAMAGTHYEAFNRKCCFEPGSSLATCKVPIITNDGICDNPDTIIRHFTCRLKPNEDKVACADVSMITIKANKNDTFQIWEDVPSCEMCRNESDSQLNEPVNLNVATKYFAEGFCLAKDSDSDRVPCDCRQAYQEGCRRDGVYTIDPECGRPFKVYCDMKNGGWTVFQRRMDGSEDFYRGWTDYVAGFGNMKREFWLGLNHINCLTSTVPRTELRVELADFFGNYKYAYYGFFNVNGASTNYTLDN